jgi:hypothetical protein
MTWRDLLFVTLATFTLACSTDKSADETVDEPPTEAKTAEQEESEQTDSKQQQKTDDPDLEVAAQLRQAPGNITVTPDGQKIVSLHQFYKPAIRVAAVGEEGALEPFPNEEWSVGTDDETPRLDSVLGLQSMPAGAVWLLDNGMRNDRTPKLVGWDTRADGSRQVASSRGDEMSRDVRRRRRNDVISKSPGRS